MTPCSVSYCLHLQGARKKDRTLTREATYSFRMLVSTYHTTQPHIGREREKKIAPL